MKFKIILIGNTIIIVHRVFVRNKIKLETSFQISWFANITIGIHHAQSNERKEAYIINKEINLFKIRKKGDISYLCEIDLGFLLNINAQVDNKTCKFEVQQISL